MPAMQVKTKVWLLRAHAASCDSNSESEARDPYGKLAN